MSTEQQYSDTEDRRSRLALVLFFLLLSFSCIFCSSQLALWAIDRDTIAMGIHPKQTADYRGGSALALAPLSGDIAAEAARDEDQLALAITPQKQGLPVAMLPIPRDTPTPPPVPTPTPQAVAVVSPPPPAPAPTAATITPPPTTTATAAASTGTAQPSTATAVAGATFTSTPVGGTATASATSPPPTSVGTVTAVPTSTATPVDTATTVPTSTATATPTDTATATATHTATSTATHTPTSTPIPPDVSFSAGAFSVGEAGGQALITTTLSSAFWYTVTVDYASSDWTALASQDYTAVSGQLVFSPGQTRQTFTVPITNDIITNELGEDVRLTLSNAVSATLVAPNPVVLTITDDDGQPTVSFAAAEYGVNEGDPLGGVDIGVRLNAPSGITVTVNYATQDNGATSPADYTSTSGTLTFTPGQLGQSFRVTIVNDTLDSTDPNESPDETLNLLLSNPISASLGTTPISLIIVDDDPTVTPGTCPIGATQETLPNIGPPNGLVAGIYCGTAMVVPVVPTTTIVADGDTAPDMVYYEMLQSNAGHGGVCGTGVQDYIFLDWVTVQVGASSTGPWYTVFLWGDDVPDTNTNVSGFSAGGEQNNEIICATALYGGNTSGITIDVDAKAPPGVYNYVRLYAPNGPDPSSTLDSIEMDSLDSIP